MSISLYKITFTGIPHINHGDSPDSLRGTYYVVTIFTSREGRLVT